MKSKSNLVVKVITSKFMVRHEKSSDMDGYVKYLYNEFLMDMVKVLMYDLKSKV